MIQTDTICAIATAQGGAIGVVRISGQEAIPLSDKIFRSRRGKRLQDMVSYSVAFGEIVDDNNKLIDEAVVTVFRNPSSYTGEDSVEISCHGSSYVLQRVLELLIGKGCRMARPGEYTQRAFLNGKIDLTQAEAVADLIASENEAQHRIAMSQMRGGISQKLSILRTKLLTMTSLLELELDFSEEDVEFADRRELKELATEIHDEIFRLSSSFHTGNAIKNGIPVAILGAPNVGKSTLLNALLQDDRAIVSDIQGTTRDIIEDTMVLSGHTFRFIDTAGIRHTTDTIERMGIDRSLRAAEKAQIIILMNEPGVDYPALDVKPWQSVIRITNKTPQFQAINAIGLPWLHKQLLAAVPHNNSEILITNIRHKEALDTALEDILRAREAITAGLSGDLIAEDLRQCLAHLAEILGGQITPDEVLGNIFKNFCIGK